MTDRVNGITVTLDKDYRDDDVVALVQAIALLHGVARVEPHIVTSEAYFIESRTKFELRDKIIKAVQEITD